MPARARHWANISSRTIRIGSNRSFQSYSASHVADTSLPCVSHLFIPAHTSPSMHSGLPHLVSEQSHLHWPHNWGHSGGPRRRLSRRLEGWYRGGWLCRTIRRPLRWRTSRIHCLGFNAASRNRACSWLCSWLATPDTNVKIVRRAWKTLSGQATWLSDTGDRRTKVESVVLTAVAQSMAKFP